MAAGDPAVPPWLRSMPLAPEYHPTESEFADPITFVARVEREAAAFGICKVVPPFPAPSRRFAFDNVSRSLADFTTRHQELGAAASCLKQVWQSGERYSLDRFESKARAFARSRLSSDQPPQPLTIESLFWRKATSEKPLYVEYANDVPGSGFAPPEQALRAKKRLPDAEGGRWLSNSPWNLQVIARAPGSLTRFMPDDVPGVTSPMVYVAMLFSWFAWHVEDHELHSLNFLHFGAPKTWYAVPGECAAEFEEAIRVRGYGEEADPLASLAMLGEKTTLLSPEVLMDAGLPCCRLVQQPGEFVVTFPRAYHIGFSHGFNCGEAANFATPQWLKFAKEAAVRRAAMNFLPMLSHQQLLYLLAISLVPRTPMELLSGFRTSRLRDRKKEEREALVKRVFLEDMVGEIALVCSLLEKKRTVGAVLWEPNMLPSQGIVLHSSHSSASPKLLKKLTDADSAVVDQHNSSADSESVQSGVEKTELDTTSPSGQSTDAVILKCCNAQSSCHGKISDSRTDVGDLPFGLSTDSGSLACVACGILGYPFMVIVQPSDKALEELSPPREESYRSSEEMEDSYKISGLHNRDCSMENLSGSDSTTKVKYSDRREEKQNNVIDTRFNVLYSSCRADKNANIGRDSCNFNCKDGSHLCSGMHISEGASAIDVMSKSGAESRTNEEHGVYGSEGRIFCGNVTRWNTGSHFVRPRIFCLHHALEIEGILCGSRMLIICHSDYLTIKALALAIADEIGTRFDFENIPLEKASQHDLHLINTAIDDEGHEEDGNDWTSKLGFNLKYCVKLRKQSPRNQEPLVSSVGKTFLAPSSASFRRNLKWLCRKARTPYRVIGHVISKSHSGSFIKKTKPSNLIRGISSFKNVYQSRRKDHTAIHKGNGRFEDEKTLCDEIITTDVPNSVANRLLPYQINNRGSRIVDEADTSKDLLPQDGSKAQERESEYDHSVAGMADGLHSIQKGAENAAELACVSFCSSVSLPEELCLLRDDPNGTLICEQGTVLEELRTDNIRGARLSAAHFISGDPCVSNTDRLHEVALQNHMSSSVVISDFGKKQSNVLGKGDEHSKALLADSCSDQERLNLGEIYAVKTYDRPIFVRENIICYERRKRKRKLEAEQKADNRVLAEGLDHEVMGKKVKKLKVKKHENTHHSVICSGFVRGPCEGLRRRPETSATEKSGFKLSKQMQTRGVTDNEISITDSFECSAKGCHMKFWTASEFIVHKRQGCKKQIEFRDGTQFPQEQHGYDDTQVVTATDGVSVQQATMLNTCGEGDNQLIAVEVGVA